jgi:hypothetical protein
MLLVAAVLTLCIYGLLSLPPKFGVPPNAPRNGFGTDSGESR